MINFASFFTIGKAHVWGTFPKCGAGLSYRLVLGPYFENAPTLVLYLTLKRHHYHFWVFWQNPKQECTRSLNYVRTILNIHKSVCLFVCLDVTQTLTTFGAL